jgi:hypothetical protein
MTVSLLLSEIAPPSACNISRTLRKRHSQKDWGEGHTALLVACASARKHAPVRSGSFASVPPYRGCDSFTSSNRHRPRRSTSGDCPSPPAVGDHTEAARPDIAGDTLGDTVSPSVSGHQMHQFYRIFNGLFPRHKSLSAPRLLINFDGLPGQADAICSLFHLCSRLPRERTNVRTN